MRASIGTAASYGCIRMPNEDVIDLFDRVVIDARGAATANPPLPELRQAGFQKSLARPLTSQSP